MTTHQPAAGPHRAGRNTGDGTMKTRKMRKPSVKAGVADKYAMAGERIVEFTTPAGRGGLISVRDDGDKTIVDVYRTDAGVDVRGGNPPRPAEADAAGFLNGLFGFLTAACNHYEKSAPTVQAHCDEMYRRLVDNIYGVSMGEVMQILQLRDLETGEFEHPNYAANRVYKLRHGLGMDTTGHAGF